MAGIGRAPIVAADSNSSTVLVADALRTGQHPERLSPMIAPPAFDADAYRRDPQAYLRDTMPGRAWQCAQPSADVPVIRKVVPGQPTLRQGEEVELAVLAAPGWPVSFTITDLGLFSNGLQAISVEADATGRAAVRFQAVSGSINNVNVVAASPKASGLVRYRIQVLPANAPAP